jgi:hypothetical protein
LHDLDRERDTRLVALREPHRLDPPDRAALQDRHAVAATLVVHETAKGMVHPEQLTEPRGLVDLTAPRYTLVDLL